MPKRVMGRNGPGSPFGVIRQALADDSSPDTADPKKIVAAARARWKSVFGGDPDDVTATDVHKIRYFLRKSLGRPLRPEAIKKYILSMRHYRDTLRPKSPHTPVVVGLPAPAAARVTELPADATANLVVSQVPLGKFRMAADFRRAAGGDCQARLLLDALKYLEDALAHKP